MANIRLLRAVSVTAFIMLFIWTAAAAVSACIRHDCRVEKDYIPFPVRERKSQFVQKGWNVWLQEGQNGYRNAAGEFFVLGNNVIKHFGFYETGIMKKPVEGIVIRGISDKKHPITVPGEFTMYSIWRPRHMTLRPSRTALNGRERPVLAGKRGAVSPLWTRKSSHCAG